MFLQVSLTVCLSESLLLSCGTLGCVCLCVSREEPGEERECSVLCLCALASVCRFDGGVEPPRANGDTAVAIYPNTSQEFTGRITRKDERRGEQHLQKLPASSAFF